MLILSQDGNHLIECDNFHIEEFLNSHSPICYRIYTTCYGLEYTLGLYDTEYDCEVVLNRIKNCITSVDYITSRKIYNMPKRDF